MISTENMANTQKSVGNTNRPEYFKPFTCTETYFMTILNVCHSREYMRAMQLNSSHELTE